MAQCGCAGFVAIEEPHEYKQSERNASNTSLSQLESRLWESANILRGPVDDADFKTYVFPLLFFKRISDAHDQEYAGALAEADT